MRNHGFRKAIIMQQHAYGEGEYRYSSLPVTGDAVKSTAGGALSATGRKSANAWRRTLGQAERCVSTDARARSSTSATRRVRPGRRR